MVSAWSARGICSHARPRALNVVDGRANVPGLVEEGGLDFIDLVVVKNLASRDRRKLLEAKKTKGRVGRHFLVHGVLEKGALTTAPVDA